MRTGVRAIALTVGAVIVATGVFVAVRAEGSPSFEGGSLLGRAAPEFSGPDLDGATFSSDSLAGRTVVVNFWNDWCLPCRQEHPALAEFWARHRDDPDFAMVGIVREMRREADIRAWVVERDVTWSVMFDPGGQAAVDFGTIGQPETFVIAPDGTVVGFQKGAVDVGDLEAMLARARGTG